MKAIVYLAAAALFAACLAPAPSSTATTRPHHRWVSPRAYAHHLTCKAATKGVCRAEWNALDTLIGRYESGWDPCAHWPSVHHDCGYTGRDSCGIPQADPCPSGWRGHLYATRWLQVRWAIAYVAGRYGDPLAALAHHDAYGWY